MRALVVSAAIATAVAAPAAAATAAGDVTVWSGVRNQVPFALVATDGPHGSFCITMQKKGRLDASECGSIFEGRAHGITYLAHFGLPGPNYVVGPVVAAATHVTVSLDDGTSLTVATIAPPRGLARNVRFYVRLMPCRAAAVRRVVGTDGDGHTVASLQLPAMAHGPRTTC
jgi:hypothetical protein